MAILDRDMLGALGNRQVGNSNPFSSGGFPNGGSGSDSGGDDGGSTALTVTPTVLFTATYTAGSDGSFVSSFGYTYRPTETSSSGSTGDGSSQDAAITTSGLSSTTIAGITVGSVLAFFVLAILFVWLCTRGRRRQQKEKGQQLLAADENDPRPGLPNSAASVYSVPPVPPLPRNHLRPRPQQTEEAVAFAKVISPSTRLSDDPPAYEESESNVLRATAAGHALGASGSPRPDGHPGLRNTPEAFAILGSVSDGFRRYDDQSVPGAESKPVDHLEPVSERHAVIP